MNLTNKKPNISVIVPTYNRNHCLCQTLTKLFEQKYSCYEIIVVDQSSKKFKAKQLFFQKNKNKFKLIKLAKANLPYARNQGIQKSQGQLILFLDDDVLVTKNLVSKHFKEYQDLRISAVVGRIVTVGQKPKTNFKNTGKIWPWGSFADGYSSTHRQEINNLAGCNFSLRKKAWLQLNGFDENFVGNALREETDLALRLKKIGGKIIFSPQAEVTHLRAPAGGCRKGKNRLGWYHDFFHNETYFFLKHLSKIWWHIFWLTRWQYFARCMFGFGRNISWQSIKTPWLGIFHGWQTYRRHNENRS